MYLLWYMGHGNLADSIKLAIATATRRLGCPPSEIIVGEGDRERVASVTGLKVKVAPYVLRNHCLVGGD